MDQVKRAIIIIHSNSIFFISKNNQNNLVDLTQDSKLCTRGSWENLLPEHSVNNRAEQRTHPSQQ